MARFEDFSPQETAVIRTALIGAQSEYYDPDHTQEERDTLQALTEEAAAAGQETIRDSYVITQTGANEYRVTPRTAREQPESTAPEALGGFDRSGRPVIRYPNGREERITAEKPTRRPFQERPKLNPGEYIGFLYIECVYCGEIHAFNARQPIKTYRCDVCGNKTTLIDLRPMRVTCECGGRYNYKTNIVTEKMDVTCFKCSSPVAVEWSDKWQKYQPMNYQPARGRHKKGGRK